MIILKTDFHVSNSKILISMCPDIFTGNRIWVYSSFKNKLTFNPRHYLTCSSYIFLRLKKDQFFLSELQAYEPKNIKESIAYISNQHF